MKTYEAYRDSDNGRVYVIDSERDADGNRVFDRHSDACQKAINDNLDTIHELLALNAKLTTRYVGAVQGEAIHFALTGK